MEKLVSKLSSGVDTSWTESKRATWQELIILLRTRCEIILQMVQCHWREEKHRHWHYWFLPARVTVKTRRFLCPIRFQRFFTDCSRWFPTQIGLRLWSIDYLWDQKLFIDPEFSIAIWYQVVLSAFLTFLAKTHEIFVIPRIYLKFSQAQDYFLSNSSRLS